MLIIFASMFKGLANLEIKNVDSVKNLGKNVSREQSINLVIVVQTVPKFIGVINWTV